ncbi:TPA: hypothetical protein IAD52_04320 [Candidatus Spyradomonas excrementavium]|nr:hypothetical protein [Candidatus Spyradomonas excrementavium]
MKNRWYDKEPTLSLAVSLMKNESVNIQVACAQLITEKAKNLGVIRQNNLLDAFNYVVLRWYENDERISEAFEYLKAASDEVRREIAIEVIEYIQKIEPLKS